MRKFQRSFYLLHQEWINIKTEKSGKFSQWYENEKIPPRFPTIDANGGWGNRKGIFRFLVHFGEKRKNYRVWRAKKMKGVKGVKCLQWFQCRKWWIMERSGVKVQPLEEGYPWCWLESLITVLTRRQAHHSVKIAKKSGKHFVLPREWMAAYFSSGTNGSLEDKLRTYHHDKKARDFKRFFRKRLGRRTW